MAEMTYDNAIKAFNDMLHGKDFDEEISTRNWGLDEVVRLTGSKKFDIILNGWGGVCHIDFDGDHVLEEHARKYLSEGECHIEKVGKIIGICSDYNSYAPEEGIVEIHGQNFEEPYFIEGLPLPDNPMIIVKHGLKGATFLYDACLIMEKKGFDFSSGYHFTLIREIKGGKGEVSQNVIRLLHENLKVNGKKSLSEFREGLRVAD